MVPASTGQGTISALAPGGVAQRVGSMLPPSGAAASCPVAWLWAIAPALGPVLRPHSEDSSSDEFRRVTALGGQFWNLPSQLAPAS